MSEKSPGPRSRRGNEADFVASTRNRPPRYLGGYQFSCLGPLRGLVRVRVAIAVAVAGAICLGLISGCSHNMHRPPSSAPLRDINAVLADHDKELLAISGVVGVYVGLLSDGKTPCLKVMLARKDPSLKRRIPRELEGHPVVTEVTGEIRPLN